MILIFFILFSFFNSCYIKVNAEDGVTPISAGTKVVLPDESEVKQYGCATYEAEDISWLSGTGQDKVNKLWEAGGKLTDENNWAYIKTPDGVNRYLVAVTPLFGNAGDIWTYIQKMEKQYLVLWEMQRVMTAEVEL